MQVVLKAIMPRYEEIIGYFVLGIIVLIVVNVTGVADAIFAISQTDVDVQEYVDSSILGYIGQISSPLNGRLGNSIIWAIFGIIAFGLGLIASSEIKDLLEHIRQAKILSNRSTKAVWAEFTVRTFFRVSALAGLIGWIHFLLTWLWEYDSRLFLESLYAKPIYFWGILGLLGGGLLLGSYLYIVAVLCRLVALRIRVFSDIPVDG